MPNVKLTKTAVEALPVGGPRVVIYRDTTLVGFGVRVSGATKSYLVEKRVSGRTVRVKLGRHPQLNCERARRLAQEELGRMTTGVNPNDERRAARARGLTLAEAFSAYLVGRPDLRATSLRSYRDAMRLMFGDWQTKPIAEITKDMVGERHARMVKERGGASANLAMRVLRAVLNFAANKFEDIHGRSILPENPVSRLSRTKTWAKVPRRQTVIRPSDLPSWIQSVLELGDDVPGSKGSTGRDYLLLLLFTGLRRQEAARIRWQDVDLKERTLTVPVTKNGEPHVLPLSSFLVDLLQRRRGEGVLGYVFPGVGASGHIVEPKRQLDRVRESSGVSFIIHDLRRTFITVAESLDISAYAVKRLANHKVSGDVTAGYVVPSIDRLREPMERIARYLMEASNVTIPAITRTTSAAN